MALLHIIQYVVRKSGLSLILHFLELSPGPVQRIQRPCPLNPQCLLDVEPNTILGPNRSQLGQMSPTSSPLPMTIVGSLPAPTTLAIEVKPPRTLRTHSDPPNPVKAKGWALLGCELCSSNGPPSAPNRCLPLYGLSSLSGTHPTHCQASGFHPLQSHLAEPNRSPPESVAPQEPRSSDTPGRRSPYRRTRSCRS